MIPESDTVGTDVVETCLINDGRHVSVYTVLLLYLIQKLLFPSLCVDYAAGPLVLGDYHFAIRRYLSDWLPELVDVVPVQPRLEASVVASRDVC